MNYVNDVLKSLFIPLSALSLISVFLYSDRVFDIFALDYLMYDYVWLFYLFYSISVIIFFIYVLIPIFKILYNRYGSKIQRTLLILSIIAFFSTGPYLYIFGGFIALYVLFLAVFLNFTSEIFESDSSYIISISPLNILLIVYIPIFMLLTGYYIYPVWIPFILSFLFVISGIIYSEKKL